MANINLNNIRSTSWLRFLVIISVIILLASAASLIRFRVDLTEDRKYTLSPPTKKILSGIKNDIYIQVFLDGDIPIPLKRLKRSVSEMLDEFRIASGRKIDYEFLNPSEGTDAKQRTAKYNALKIKGLNAIDVNARDAEGGSTKKTIFPGMLVNSNGKEVPVNFLNNSSSSYDQIILRSVEGLEYNMIQTIATLNSDTIFKIAFIEGQGELPEIETADITFNLLKYFDVERGTISGKIGILNKYSAVIIAGPEKEFNESDKLVLDQYIMNGGKVLWLFEEVAVNADSLVYGSTVGLYRPLNLEDQLFRYGARVNPLIVQDLECLPIPIMVMNGNTRQQVVSVPWVYYPLLSPSLKSPITRNLNRVLGAFSNYIDTVGLDPAIKKKVLLTTSNLSRTLSPPILISLKEAELTPNDKDYNKSNMPVAVLLEGIFPSAFTNRMTGNLTEDKSFKAKTESSNTKMIVIADADIIRNDVSRADLKEIPLTLGLDKYTGQVFGNKDFLINCLNYLVDDNGLMELRSREVKLRMLNTALIKQGKLKWQLINIAGPVTVVIIAGLLYNYFRRKKYTRF